MIPGSFQYHRPGTVDEAVSILAEHGDEGRPLAGGQSLIAMMKLRLAAPSHLVDLQDIADLAGIDDNGDHLSIGPMTTQAEILDSDTVKDRCPLIQEAARQIADPQVRYVGTIGGNVANGDPGNDMPAIMMCLGADYVLKGANGERTVGARDFYQSSFITAMEDGELMTAIRVPVPPQGHGFAYEKLKRKVGDYATAATAVILVMDGGKCDTASVALTNLGETAIYAEEASASLVGSAIDDAAIEKAAEIVKGTIEPFSDLKGTVEYRTAMAGVMTSRAIRLAAERGS
ncbi:MAG: xanthine dehydrogenase family protein subunit M [Proteobacteria bacterium]|nr:xanthine dehydrogenase family protein subunit M [Pseudomonadota bacterium]MCH8236830.1 xanthine dehydrogenase family protein subunit M [Pseudomonadota bacterium]